MGKKFYEIKTQLKNKLNIISKLIKNNIIHATLVIWFNALLIKKYKYISDWKKWLILKNTTLQKEKKNTKSYEKSF